MFKRLSSTVMILFVPAACVPAGPGPSEVSTLPPASPVPTNTNVPATAAPTEPAADGNSLYYSQEPYGIGGYIPFSGASSLYQVTLADKKITEIIPFTPQNGPSICLDALSSDDRLVADHCSSNGITIRDLQSGQTSTIQPPAEVKDSRLKGSARFSPVGLRCLTA